VYPRTREVGHWIGPKTKICRIAQDNIAEGGSGTGVQCEKRRLQRTVQRWKVWTGQCLNLCTPLLYFRCTTYVSADKLVFKARCGENSPSSTICTGDSRSYCCCSGASTALASYRNHESVPYGLAGSCVLCVVLRIRPVCYRYYSDRWKRVRSLMCKLFWVP
jgi:hypothetical protein